MHSKNYRANWLDRWGYRVPPLESTQPSDRELIPARAEILLHEGVEKALQEANMTQEAKDEIRAIMREAQSKAGPVKLSLASTKGIPRLKRFLNKFLPAKPNGEGVTGPATSALPPGTFRYTRNETVESLVERALKDRKNAGVGAND